jgi:hypothetical protein
LEKHTPEEHFQCSDGNLLHGGTNIWNSLQSGPSDDQLSASIKHYSLAKQQEVQSMDACYFPLAMYTIYCDK